MRPCARRTVHNALNRWSYAARTTTTTSPDNVAQGGGSPRRRTVRARRQKLPVLGLRADQPAARSSLVLAGQSEDAQVLRRREQLVSLCVAVPALLIAVLTLAMVSEVKSLDDGDAVVGAGHPVESLEASSKALENPQYGRLTIRWVLDHRVQCLFRHENRARSFVHLGRGDITTTSPTGCPIRCDRAAVLAAAYFRLVVVRRSAEAGQVLHAVTPLNCLEL